MTRFVLLGPTGIGKTELAIELALSMNAEIISADSMQIYEHMAIGTAQPSEEQQQKVPHHLIGYVSPRSDYNAKRYLEDAWRIISDIEKRGKRVLVTGGTGLYLRALLQGLLDDDEECNAKQKDLEQFVEVHGIETLREELKIVDPEKYALFPKNDHRRIIRAVAFFRTHQKPISALQKEWKRPMDKNFVLIGLQMERLSLYRRIEERVDWMMKKGLAEEAKKLMDLNLPENATCRQAIGHKELEKFWRGESSLEDAVLLIKQESRRYAKRQLTWFRKIDNIQWFSMESSGDLKSKNQIKATNLKDDILRWISELPQK